jgi:hypothetical protein
MRQFLVDVRGNIIVEVADWQVVPVQKGKPNLLVEDMSGTKEVYLNAEGFEIISSPESMVPADWAPYKYIWGGNPTSFIANPDWVDESHINHDGSIG